MARSLFFRRDQLLSVSKTPLSIMAVDKTKQQSQQLKRQPRVLIPMADYGHDPTEVAVPYRVFVESGFSVDFATESGSKAPECDSMMLRGLTGALLGADASGKSAHDTTLLSSTSSYHTPLKWTDIDVTAYDLVFLPGGHEKGVRQLIDSSAVHDLLRKFFPLTDRSSSDTKVVAAICHGVQALAFTSSPESPLESPLLPGGTAGQLCERSAGYRSIIHDATTTALPGFMETSITTATRLFLGDYYKTYGHGSPTVEDYVKHGLDDPDAQFDAGPGVLTGKMNQPFVVEDAKYRYVSGRFPPDAQAVAKRAVELVNESLSRGHSS